MKPKKVKKIVKNIEKKIVDDTTDEEEGTKWSDKSSDDVDICENLPSGFEELDREPVEEDFVLVQVCDKQKYFYVGKVMKQTDKEGDLEISFLRKNQKILNVFIWPSVPDVASVPNEDIKLLLSAPMRKNGTKRTQSFLSFEVNFFNLNVR